MATLARVRALREAQALTQRELGDRAGVHRITVVHAERGRHVRPEIMRKLAAALGVTPAALVSAEGSPAPAPGHERHRAGAGAVALRVAVSLVVSALYAGGLSTFTV